MAGSHPSSRPSRVRGIAEGLDRVFRQLMVLFALLALMLAAVFSYLIGSIRPDLDRYRESDRSLDLAHAAMIDQETGLRGFLLMHDPAFLELAKRVHDCLGRALSTFVVDAAKIKAADLRIQR